MHVLAGLLVTATMACGGPSSPRTMQRAEKLIGAGLVGILTTSLVYYADQRAQDVLVPVIAGFGGLTLGAFAVYFYAAMTEEDPQPAMALQRADNQAWDFTQRAEQAARAGDCALVAKFSPAVRKLDADFHAKVFMRDAAIKRCLDAR